MKRMIFIMVWCLISNSIMAALPFATDKLTTKKGDDLEIGFIKHGSLMITFNGNVIYVDPVSDYTDYSILPKADVILITHEHADHLDEKAIADISKSGTVIFSNAASAKILGCGRVLKNGDKVDYDKWLGLEAVPAYNTTEGHEQFHPHNGRDNGYIVTLGESRIYVSGDTEDIPEMKKLKNIDVAFLPVNQPYTMTVEQAINAAKMFMPKILYPYHYGETKVAGIVDGLKSEPGIEVRIRDLE